MPGPVATRLALLQLWSHALRLPGRPPPTMAELRRAASRWARADRLRGYRVLAAVPAPTVAPWSNAE